MKTLRFLLPLIILATTSCFKDPTTGEAPFRYDVKYKVDESNFCNPERGLYVPAIKYFRSNFLSGPSDVEWMRGLRNNGRTFTYSEFYLMGFVYQDLSEEAL